MNSDCADRAYRQNSIGKLGQEYDFHSTELATSRQYHCIWAGRLLGQLGAAGLHLCWPALHFML